MSGSLHSIAGRHQHRSEPATTGRERHQSSASQVSHVMSPGHSGRSRAVRQRSRCGLGRYARLRSVAPSPPTTSCARQKTIRRRGCAVSHYTDTSPSRLAPPLRGSRCSVIASRIFAATSASESPTLNTLGTSGTHARVAVAAIDDDRVSQTVGHEAHSSAAPGQISSSRKNVRALTVGTRNSPAASARAVFCGVVMKSSVTIVTT